MKTLTRLSDRFRLKTWAFALLICLVAPLTAPLTASAANEPDLTIFFSSDTRGMLRRCGCTDGQLGGLSARAQYIKKHLNNKTIVLDIGDTIFEDFNLPEDMKSFYTDKAAVLMSAMKEAGYMAAAVGEYDLSLGTSFLKSASSNAGFPLLAANLFYKDGSRPFQPHTVRNVAGVKVAVIGLMDSEFPYKDFPKSFEGVTVSNPVKAYKDDRKKLAGKADFTIVLAHEAVSDVVKLAKTLPGADVVIQGHSEDVLDKPIMAGDTLVFKGFYKGKQIGRLDLWFNRANGKVTSKAGSKVKNYKYAVIPLDESLPANPAVEKIIANYQMDLHKKSFTSNRPDPQPGGAFVGPKACKPCHAQAYTNWSATGHAKAFASLMPKGDQFDPECLPCHVTGYWYISGYKRGHADMESVGCEDCHGSGEAHVLSKAKMPKKVDEAACHTCHDNYNSPDFDYAKYLGMGGAHKGPALK
ncbi:MAG TPA: multiheme c-type cytochrome [Nitrospirota bacterium]